MKRFLLQRFPDGVWDNLATISVLGMCCVLGLFGWFIYDLTNQNKHRIRDTRVLAQQTNQALCLFRRDLEQRVQGTQKYLDEHPGPEPFPGVSRTSILQSLANQRRTVRSLSNLNCKEE